MRHPLVSSVIDKTCCKMPYERIFSCALRIGAHCRWSAAFLWLHRSATPGNGATPSLSKRGRGGVILPRVKRSLQHLRIEFLNDDKLFLRRQKKGSLVFQFGLDKSLELKIDMADIII